MTGKKAIILTLLVILTIQVVFPIKPALAQSHVATCSSGVNSNSILGFIGTIATGYTGLWTLNFITSALAGAEFGIPGVITVKDLFEPIDQAADFLFDWWMRAVFFGVVGSLGALMAGYLVEVAIDLNAGLLTNNAVINAGYGTILSLVNLGFVVAIIIMAFATMLRRSGWDAQSSLARLIIAALLINFSLFFAGIVLDLGTGLMSTILGTNCWGLGLANQFNIVNINNEISSFLGSAGGVPSIFSTLGSLGSAITSFIGSFIPGGMSPSQAFDAITKVGTDLVGAVVSNFFISILSIFFASALTIIGALTLFGIFLFLIARYVAIIILLIFMPVIWLGLVFPKLSLPGVGNAWSGWWNHYLKWVFTGPLLVFFLYLTVAVINNLNATNPGGIFNAVAQLIVVVIFSLAGLWAANRLSIAGASVIYGSVAKLGAKGLASIKATGVGMATAPLRTEAGQKMLAGAAAGRKLTLFGREFTIPTGTKGLGREGLTVAREQTSRVAEAAVKKYSALPKDQKNKILSGLPPASAEFAGLFEHLIKEKQLENPAQYFNARVRTGLTRTGKVKTYNDLEKALLMNSSIRSALELNDQQKIDKEIASIVKDLGAAEVKDKVWLKDVLSKDATNGLSQEEHNRRRDAFLKATFTTSSAHVGELFKALNREQKIAFQEESQRIISDLANEGKLTNEIKKWWETHGGQRMFSLYRETTTKKKSTGEEKKA